MSIDRSRWHARQLPPVLLEGGTPQLENEQPFAERFLQIFDETAVPIQEMIDELALYFDPSVAPLEFVRWLGRWFGVSLTGSLDEGLQRRIVSARAATLPSRGTANSVHHWVAAWTGPAPEIIEHPGWRPTRSGFALTVLVDSLGPLTADELAGLVAAELPADVDAEHIEIRVK